MTLPERSTGWRPRASDTAAHGSNYPSGSLSLRPPRQGDAGGGWGSGWAPGASDVRLVTAPFRIHRFVPHAHSEYAIAVIGRGAEAVRYRGADEYTGAGSLLLLDAEAIHAAATLRPEGLSLTCTRQGGSAPSIRG